MERPILEIKNLQTYFYVDGKVLRAVDGLSYSVGRGECVAVVVEPYPGRFTHHVLVEREEELDEELFSFLAMAWEFGENKGRGSKGPHGRK